MRNDRAGYLGAEEELGLFGELDFLDGLVGAGLGAQAALLSWQGPRGGLHDFAFDHGAIEVKTTFAVSGFAARITSLDQLDDCLVAPLFLAGVRLKIDSSGETLPARVRRLRATLAIHPDALILFENALLHAGYSDAAASFYTRAFSPDSTRLFAVSGDFPRVTRGTVPAQVLSVRYELDLDLVNSPEIDLRNALQQLGVVA